jgi:hypothetical protein
MSQPYFGQVWGWSPTLGKSEDLESSGTPECSKLDSKGKNTSHWGVLGVVGKILKRRYRKCPRIWQFGYLQPKLWAKEGPGVKLTVWLPTTKTRESMPSRHSIWACDMELERSRQGLQLRFRPRRDPSRQSRVMAIQSSGSPFRESREFVPLGCRCGGASQSIL